MNLKIPRNFRNENTICRAELPNTFTPWNIVSIISKCQSKTQTHIYTQTNRMAYTLFVLKLRKYPRLSGCAQGKIVFIINARDTFY